MKASIRQMPIRSTQLAVAVTAVWLMAPQAGLAGSSWSRSSSSSYSSYSSSLNGKPVQRQAAGRLSESDSSGISRRMAWSGSAAGNQPAVGKWREQSFDPTHGSRTNEKQLSSSETLALLGDVGLDPVHVDSVAGRVFSKFQDVDAAVAGNVIAGQTGTTPTLSVHGMPVIDWPQMPLSGFYNSFSDYYDSLGDAWFAELPESGFRRPSRSRPGGLRFRGFRYPSHLTW